MEDWEFYKQKANHKERAMKNSPWLNMFEDSPSPSCHPLGRQLCKRSLAPGHRPGCGHSGLSIGSHTGSPWQAAQKIWCMFWALPSPEVVALKDSSPTLPQVCTPGPGCPLWASVWGCPQMPSSQAEGRGSHGEAFSMLTWALGPSILAPASPFRQPQAHTTAAAFVIWAPSARR